ncbi:MAG TPA: hypothetical protein PKC21_10070 [Oligoflexia bacterium]|nr:hypothetical protein [Oligoflexia bacterium]HMR25686.1 hypothetical protein [Oligoflexia bacterium]
MKKPYIIVNMLLGVLLIYAIIQIQSLKRTIKDLKQAHNDIPLAAVKETSLFADKKQSAAVVSPPYDNTYILSVLDYLQEEIDHIKDKTQNHPSNLSQTNPPSKTKAPSTNNFPKLGLKSHDLNNNRSLSAEEAKLNKLNFSSYDINEDGQISESEIDATLKRIDKAQKHVQERDRADAAFPIEHSAWSRSQKEFNFIDKDNNFNLDESEYIYYLSHAKQQLRRFDYNRDAWIGFDEFGQGQGRFAQIDNDSDQKITEHEVRRALYLGFW